jgi:hypothetical protein
MKHIDELQPNGQQFNLRGIPTHICLCGSRVWNVKCMFEENEISMYFLDMHCASCGSPATAPTPELDCE